MSWNVRGLRDGRAAVAQELAALDADVVCLQEMPRFVGWRWAARRLARDARLQVLAGGRPAAGVMVLCRPGLPVLHAASHLLTPTLDLHRRGVAVATLGTAEPLLTVASVHLGLDARERVRHVTEIATLLDRLPRPHVVAGDLNESPGEPAWEALAAGTAPRLDGPTFPARDPARVIDAVLAHPPLEVVDYGVADSPGLRRASDHLPVVATVRLPPR